MIRTEREAAYLLAALAVVFIILATCLPAIWERTPVAPWSPAGIQRQQQDDRERLREQWEPSGTTDLRSV